LILNHNAKIQIIINYSYFNSIEIDKFTLDVNNIKRGDIIGVSGFIGRSKAGELSLFATDFAVLTPCLQMLPSNESGLTHKETRYKKR